jgi:hypothetical protein
MAATKSNATRALDGIKPHHAEIRICAAHCEPKVDMVGRHRDLQRKSEWYSEMNVPATSRIAPQDLSGASLLRGRPMPDPRTRR